MERPLGKELALAPLQEWGEEEVDGAVYHITLRRQRSQRPGPGGGRGRGRGQAPDSGRSEDFVHYRTCKVRALRAAPLERLVLELVRGDHEQDPAFVPAFLATHRAFVPTDRVLGLLLQPRQAPRPRGERQEEEGQGPLDVSQEQELRNSRQEDRQGLMLDSGFRALITVLGSWLLDHPQDFKDPPSHSNLVQVCTFLRWAAPGGPESQEAERLLRHFQEEEEEEVAKTLQEEEEGTKEALEASEPSHDESPGSEDPLEEEERQGKEGPELLDFSVDEIAEQLTLMDMELFSQVCLWECLGSVWSHRDRAGGLGSASSVRATVAQFNAVTGCVLSSVLAGPSLPPPHRAQRLEKWIFIAQRCRELRNFSSLRAILSALQSNPIYRLKRSWGAVSREPLSMYRKLSNIFSDENNHLNSREILSQEEATVISPEEKTAPGVPPLFQKVPPGPIPYLGTFLTDLVMLDTALPDLLEGDLINFEKRRKEWEILSRIQHLQRRCVAYNLLSRPPVLAAFRAQRPLSEEQSYRLSRVIEPPAASCPSSPRIRRRISLTKRLSAKLSRERGSSPSHQPGDPPSPSPSLSSGSYPPSPGEGDPLTLSPPPSPGATGLGHKGSLELPLGTEAPELQQAPGSPGSSARAPHHPGQPSPDACVIRVSIDHDPGNLYRSIWLTSQDKVPGVILRALQKLHLGQPQPRDYQLFQVLPGDRELLIPDNANVFYAMSPASPRDFVLRKKEGAQSPP
ncbi:ral guanine nucleotide dissociation stimulator-like 3 isoform X2 [Monodelphis domestica]|uniref:ral guanine nucleotide dissociation stimulator-like 3 isoform X2 n=1 Tax=Monodelphis domestica TaxID=13616 RepID=UPI000443103F|nr:ral guanine nucleotide dissociation stimulator-like 3 isoform X2 [Monodelphis domestica]